MGTIISRVSLINDIRNFTELVEKHIAGSASFPDIPASLLHAFPDGSFFNIKAGRDRGGQFVSAEIRRRPSLTMPRIFDLLIFAGLRLLEIVCRIRVHRDRSENDPAKHYYLRLEAPSAFGRPRPYLLRVIANTPAFKKTAQLPADHHDYRQSVLDQFPWQEGTVPQVGREEAINLAVDLFRNSQMSNLLSAEEYDALIRQVFAAADFYASADARMVLRSGATP